MNRLITTLLALLVCCPSLALDRPGTVFKIFQFPPNMIPRIDGNAEDWNIVPDDYAIGMDQLVDDTDKDRKPDPKDLDVRVKVGWVKGLNRLYFLYEAYDNYWDFGQPGLHNDTFELVVDGDALGRPVDSAVPTQPGIERAGGALHHAWCAGAELSHHDSGGGKGLGHGVGLQRLREGTPLRQRGVFVQLQAGRGGKLVLEFWITPFDYAGCEGPQRAVESVLTENKLIGMAWAVLDYDDAHSEAHRFWNLSRQHTMYGKAEELVGFRLMPLEPRLVKFDAKWSYQVVDMKRRLVAFRDESTGKVTAWKWNFGDGKTSTEQNPIHQYQTGADYTVVLEVDGPEGKTKREKIWEVGVK